MAALIDLSIAGRTYQVACREGEEENLRAAARLVDGKAREALAGLGTLSEARQFLFASLLLADQMIEGKPDAAPPPPPPEPAGPDPVLVERAERLASHLESLAAQLENSASNPKVELDGYCPVRAFGKSLRLRIPKGAVPAWTLVWIIRRPPDVCGVRGF
jgi:cell division protein ZapA